MSTDKGFPVSYQSLRKIIAKFRDNNPRSPAYEALRVYEGQLSKIESLEREISAASFFKKRGLKKELQKQEEILKKYYQQVIQATYQEARRLWNLLVEEYNQDIITFMPDQAMKVKEIELPRPNDPKDVHNFAKKVLDQYQVILDELRARLLQLVLKNRELIEIYSQYTEIQESRVEQSRQTTPEMIELLSIKELLDKYRVIKAEEVYLKEIQQSMEGKLKGLILESASTLLRNIETAESLEIPGLEEFFAAKDRLENLKEQIEKSDNVEELLKFEREIRTLNRDFNNQLLRLITGIKTETEHQLGRLQATGRRMEDLLPEAPAVDVSTTNTSVLIQYVEHLRSWQKQAIFVVKRYLDADNLLDAYHAITQMGFQEPDETLEESIRNMKDHIENTFDLNELVEVARQFEAIKAKLSDSIKNRYYQLVESPTIQHLLSLDDPTVPKPPEDVDFKSYQDPSGLITIARRIYEWQGRLATYLRNVDDLDQLIVIAKKANEYGVNLPEGLLPETEELRETVLNAQTLEELLNLQQRRRSVQQQLADVLRQRVISLKNLRDAIARMIEQTVDFPEVFIDEKSPQSMVRALDTLLNWLQSMESHVNKVIKKRVSELTSMLESSLAKTYLGEEIHQEGRQLLAAAPRVITQGQLSIKINLLEQFDRFYLDVAQYLRNEILGQIREYNSYIRELENLPMKLRRHAPELKLDDLLLEEMIDESMDVQQLFDTLSNIPKWQRRLAERVIENLQNIELPPIATESQYDLREKKQEFTRHMEDLMEQGDLYAVIKEYRRFLTLIEETKQALLIEIRSRIDNLQKLQNRLRKMTMDSSINLTFTGPPVDESSLFPEVLSIWWQLDAYVQRRTTIIAETLLRHLRSQMEDFTQLPEQYRGFFTAVIAKYKEAMASLETIDNLNEMVDMFEETQRETYELAMTGFHNMHRSLVTKMRVSLPRIRELVNVPPEINQAEQQINQVEVNATTTERIAHLVRSVIMDYETRILESLTELAMLESSNILKAINILRECEIDVTKFIGDTAEDITRQLVESTEEVPAAEEDQHVIGKVKLTLQDLADIFGKLDDLKQHPTALSTIREKAEQFLSEIHRAVDMVGQLYDENLNELVLADQQDFLANFNQITARSNLLELTEAVQRVHELRTQVIKVIKALEKERNDQLQAYLDETYRYYPSIREIFINYLDEASKSIFPLKELQQKLRQMRSSNDLAEILTLLPEIEEYKRKWAEMVARLNRWHKAIILFQWRFTPSTVVDDVVSQYREIRRRINETYPGHQTIQAYLSLIMRRLIEKRTGTKLDSHVIGSSSS